MAEVLTATPVDCCSKCGNPCALDEYGVPRSVMFWSVENIHRVAKLGSAHCRVDGYLHDALPDLTNATAVRLWNSTY